MSRVIIAAVNDWETNLAYCANSMFNLTDDFLYCYGNLWTLYVRGKMDSGAVTPSGHNSSLIKTGRKKNSFTNQHVCYLVLTQPVRRGGLQLHVFGGGDALGRHFI